MSTSYFPVCCIFWRYFSSMAACILISRIRERFFHMINLILYNQMINEVTSLKLYLLKELLPIYHFFFLFKRPSTQIKCMYTAIGEKLLLICVKRNTFKRGVPNGVSFFLKSNEYYWLIQTFTDIIGHEDLYTSWMWGN